MLERKIITLELTQASLEVYHTGHDRLEQLKRCERLFREWGWAEG